MTVDTFMLIISIASAILATCAAVISYITWKTYR